MSAKKWERRVRISPEQALRLAKQTLAPDWYQSIPLAMAVPAGESGSIAALEATFLEGYWVVFLIDPSEFGAIDWFMHLSALYRRFHNLNLRVVGVIDTPVKILMEKVAVEPLISASVAKFPIFCDRMGQWRKALGFGASKMGAAVLHQGKIVHSAPGMDMAFIEAALPQLLRKEDPGLPLWAPLPMLASVPRTSGGINFGLNTGSPTGFKGDGAKIELVGKWSAEKEWIVPAAPGCMVKIQMESPILGALVHSHSGTATPSSVRITVEGGFFDGANRGGDVDEDTDGNARIHVNEPTLYSVAKGLPVGTSVELSFPDPKNFPVTLMALRFGTDSAPLAK